MRKLFVIEKVRFAALLSLLFTVSIHSQIMNCDFWGTAKVHGVDVTSSDVIKAYDSGNQLCGTAYYVGGGNYAIHVMGDIPGSTGDEGAPEGGAITFKINDEVATVVSGNNVFNNNESKQCNLDVISGPSEYYVRVDSPYGTTHGAGWYTAGSDVLVSVDSTVSIGPGHRWKFLQWHGQGDGSYTGNANPAPIRVNASIVQTAEWKEEYFVDIQSEYGKPSGEGWYQTGSTATIRCDTVFNIQTGKRARFSGWSGTGNGSYTGGLWLKTLTVNAPITETVQWRIQYLLMVVSEHGTARGIGWYDDGSRATFSIDTLVNQGSDTRYRFKRWDGLGVGSYSGNFNPVQVIMTAHFTEEAVWNEEYFITVAIDPARSGMVSPFDAGGGWGQASDPLDLRAIGKADSGYVFSYWSGDASGSANPLSFVPNGPKRITAHFKKGNVIITTEPPGRTVAVDGKENVAPVAYDWQPGEKHRLDTDSLQSEGVTARYKFFNWNDGGAINHEITVPSTSKKYIARFEESYFLDVDSKFGNFTGEGWYVKGTTATVSVDTLANATQDSRQKFKGWAGTGQGSVSSDDPVIQCQVLGPITEKTQWEEQVRVQVFVFPLNVSGALIQISPQLDWYPLDSQVTLRAFANDPGHPFVKWTGNWSGNATSTNNPFTLTVSKPLSIRGWFWVEDPPPVISHFPDLILKEDETLNYQFDWLRQFISDPNDPIETLDIQFNGPEHVAFIVDFEKQQLTIMPVLHWNGTENAVVTVTDPFGLSDSDTFLVKVVPIEDPPEHFELLFPPNNAVFSKGDAPIEFRWHRAVDPDSGDTVEYSLILGDSPDLRGTRMSKKTTPSADTTLLVSTENPGTYYWGVLAQDKRGNTTPCDSVFMIRFIPEAVEVDGKIPLTYELGQNYPNPFNPGTTIPFQVPRPGNVTIKIYDMNGRVVRTLENGRFNTGSYETHWDGRDENRLQVASGVYVIWIQAGDFIKQRKMVLMK